MSAESSIAIKAGVDDYHKDRDSDDIDLIAEVREILNKAGLNNKLEECFENHRFILEAKNRPSKVQRFLLNRYWTQQLLYAKKQSIEERYCLIPNGEIKDWIKLFNEKVLPFIIDNDLPIPI